MLLAALSWLAAGSVARADPCPEAPYSVREGAAQPAALMAHVCALFDPSGQLDFESLRGKQHAFRLLPRAHWNVGYSSGAFWLRLPLRQHETAPGLWYLSVYQAVDDARLFVQRADGGLSSQRLGRRMPFALRPVPSGTLYFPITLGPETSQVFLRLQSHDTLQLALELVSASELASRLGANRLEQGLYFGALLALIAYNLLLYLRLRDRLYLEYALFQASIASLQATLDQLAYAWLWPEAPDWNARSEVVCFGAAMFFACAFSRRFLETAQRLTRLDRVLRCLQWLAAGIGLSCFLVDWLPFVRFCMAYLFVCCSVLLIAGVAAWRAESRTAPVYVLAWLVLLAGACLSSLTSLGMIGVSEASLHSTRVGSALEAILLALGLAQRIQWLRQEKEAAQETLLQERAAYTERLERDVHSRTQQLSQTLETLKSTQTSMMRQARLAALGHLVDGIVHELGNPLNFLRGSAESLPQSLDRATRALAQLGDRTSKPARDLARSLDNVSTATALIATGTERIRQILDNLRDYASSRPIPAAPFDLERALRTTLSLVAPRLEAQQVALDLDVAALPSVLARPGEINQVLTNLIVNALQAMPEGGTLTLRARADACWVRVAVEDDGHGIAEEIRDAIFDPFFTTRAPSEGTGLGLSIAREIARRHAGDLLLRPCSRGAAFELSLPRAEPCSAALSEEPISPLSGE